MKKPLYIFTFLSIILSISSCVIMPKKGYQQLMRDVAQIKQSDSICQSNSEMVQLENDDLKSKIELLNRDVNTLKSDTAYLNQTSKSNDRRLEEMIQQYNSLNTAHRQLLDNSSQESSKTVKLKKDLTEADKIIGELEDDLLDRDDEIKELKSMIEKLKNDLEDYKQEDEE